MNAGFSGRTLIRKTSLLHKIGPMTRRSSFVNKIVLQLASSHDEASAENDLEIVMARATACTTQLGSISSSRCQKSRMLLHPEQSMRNCLSSRTHSTLITPDAKAIWWSQTGSNRRPHACKARALPAELWPRTRRRKQQAVLNARQMKWWAWEDLNFRPHAYQARALTN